MSLTEATLSRIEKVFEQKDVPKVKESILELLNHTEHPKLNERIHIGLIKCSEGKYDELLEAIELANTDWRDLLVNAGFADDTEAHLSWNP